MDFITTRNNIKPLLLSTKGNITRTRILINKDIELKNKLELLFLDHPNYLTILKLALAIYNDFELPYCINCNKQLKYNQYDQRQQFCSPECSKYSELGKQLAKEKREQTMLKRYSNKNASNIEEFKEKRKQTNLKRFNSTSYFGSNEHLEQTKITLQTKYGFDNAAQIPEFKVKTQETNLKKYGHKYPLQAKVVKDKIIETNLERYGVKSILCLNKVKEEGMMRKYGVKYSMHSPLIRAKMTNTLLERYRVTHNMKNPLILAKKEATNIERYGSTTPFGNKDILNKTLTSFKTGLWDNYQARFNQLDNLNVLTTFDEYLNTKEFRFFKLQCTICSNIFESYLTSYRLLVLPVCPLCNKGNTSDAEFELLQYIRSLCSTELKLNSRTIIPPLELDCYIPDKKIAIEYNGLYWHSELKGKDSNYHLSKTKHCEDLGINLIHIFEDDWLYSKNKVKNLLKHKLKAIKYTIDINKCKIKTVDKSLRIKFLSKYSLFRDINKITSSLGLFYKNRLVGMVSLSNNTILDYTIINNFSIPEGFQYLINNFDKKISILVDRSLDNYKEYEKFGFIKVNEVEPRCFQIKGYRRYISSDEDSNKIWDSGQVSMEMKKGNRYWLPFL